MFDYIKNNKFDKLIDLIKIDNKYDINVRDENGNYLITYAIIKNKIDVVELLLSKNARIDIFDQEGRSILYLPTKYGYDQIIRLLIEYNQKNIGITLVDLKDKHNNIPIHYAIFFKNLQAIKLLIKSDSNTNTTDTDGNNSLHLAVYTKNIVICKLILMGKKQMDLNPIVHEYHLLLNEIVYQLH